MFKRRNPISYWEWIVETVYPRAGWRRVIGYLRHRVQRLPDTPHRIALGFACGIFVCFTPIFGLHIISAMVMAYLLRGNVVASVIGTFFGNPITFPFIATLSYRLGWLIVGNGHEVPVWRTIKHGFREAFHGLYDNFVAIFTPAEADWTGFHEFWNAVFVPYMIGGVAPGVLLSLGAYIATRPLISAYQKRRRGRRMAKIKELRSNNRTEADAQ